MVHSNVESAGGRLWGTASVPFRLHARLLVTPSTPGCPLRLRSCDPGTARRPSPTGSRPERLLQLLQGAAHLGLDGADGAGRHLRDLFVRQVAVLTHQE